MLQIERKKSSNIHTLAKERPLECSGEYSTSNLPFFYLNVYYFFFNKTENTFTQPSKPEGGEGAEGGREGRRSEIGKAARERERERVSTPEGEAQKN